MQNISMSDAELLKFAIENGMIDTALVQERIEMQKRAELLEMHNYDIWQGNNEFWYTYLPDNEKGRKLVKKKTKESVENEIVRFYKSIENEPTMLEVFNQWKQKKLDYGEMTKQTADRYERDFSRFFGKSNWKQRKIRYITEEELEDFIRNTIHQMRLTAKSWGNLRTLLNGMFKFARRNGYTVINISNFMSELELSKKIFAKVEKTEFDNVFTPEELNKLIGYLHSKPTLNNLGILLAMYTGMRVGEITGLKKEDICENYIYVHRTQIRYKGADGKDVYEIRDSPKSDAGNRKIAICSKAKPIVKQLLKMSFGREIIFQKGDSLVTIHAMTCSLYYACDKVGIHKRSMHVLRKTFATHLIDAGVEPSVIINQMGHTEFSTTTKHYYYNDKSMVQIADSVNRAINF